MKKLFLFIILILAIASIVEAGKTIKIDFSEQREQIVEVNKGDRIEFSLNGGVHTIIADKIHEDGIDIDVFRFINLDMEDRPPVQYKTAIKAGGGFATIDLESDKVTDLLVESVVYNSDKAILILKLPSDNEITGNVVDERDVNDPSGKIGLILEIALGLIIIVLIYFVFVRKKDIKDNIKKEGEI